MSPKETMFYPFCWGSAPSSPRAFALPFPLFCALPAAADVLSATGGDPKTPGAGDPARGPGQAVGTGDQKLADALRMVLSRGLLPSLPSGTPLGSMGRSRTKPPVPREQPLFLYFLPENETRSPQVSSGTWCRFLLAFSKQWCLR